MLESSTPAPSDFDNVILAPLYLAWCPFCRQWLIHLSGYCLGHQAGPDSLATPETQRRLQSSELLPA